MSETRELAKTFREITDIFEELADIEENNELDAQQKEETTDLLLGKLMVKMLKIKQWEVSK